MTLENNAEVPSGETSIPELMSFLVQETDNPESEIMDRLPKLKELPDTTPIYVTTHDDPLNGGLGSVVISKDSPDSTEPTPTPPLHTIELQKVEGGTIFHFS